MLWRLVAAALAVGIGLAACGDEEGKVPALECAAGEAICGSACSTLEDDPRNCGSCGNICGAGEACVAGACAASCPSGQATCDGACQPIENAPAHCGACGNACAAGEVCGDGACRLECPGGQTDCDGACQDLQSSHLNCGGCGLACAPGELCLAGACTADERCPAGLTDCDGTCRALQTDRFACGGCGTICAADELCSDGSCERTCREGFLDCDGGCTDPASDRRHCGACGNACGAGETCEDGACLPSCTGFAPHVCDGACTNTALDARNCGGCGNACETGQVCSDGACAWSCSPELALCDGGCTTTDHDPDNCGACGNACTAGVDAVPVCFEGYCQVACAPDRADCDGDLGTAGGNGCEVHLAGDAANCGACGVVCPPVPNGTLACAAGACGVGVCEAGWDDCDGSAANGCETSLLEDGGHCGACGVVCGAAEVCVAGACLAEGAGESCSDPFVLAAGENVITRRPIALDHFVAAPSCSAAAPAGSDLVLRFDATRTGPADVVIDGTASGRRHAVAAGQACGSLAPEAACASAIDGEGLRLAFAAQAGSSYFIYLADTAAGSLAAGIPLRAQLTEYDCASFVPSVATLIPANGGALDGTIAVEFGSAVRAAGGSIVLTGDAGTNLTIPTDGPAITFSADGRRMTIDPGVDFPPGELLDLTWSGLTDANCGNTVAPPAWSFTAPAPPCSPGVGGMVGNTIVARPSGVLGSFQESFVAADTDPNGHVYVGGTSELVRMPKAGGAPPEPIHLLAGLGASHLGYAMLIDGRNHYLLESKSSGTSGHLFRISTDGGASWRIEDAAQFGVSPADDFRSLAAWGGRIYMLTQEGTATVDTQIWSIHGSGVPLPAVATLDRSFGANAYRNCAGLVVDDANFYVSCLVGTTSDAAVLRVDRTTGAITVIASGLRGNTTKMEMHGRDHDGDGIMDFLYRNSDRRDAHFICDPAGSPFAGEHHVFGPPGNQSFGLGYDPMANVLWVWNDVENELLEVR